MEKPDLYENDLTDENLPSPGKQEEAAHKLRLDPDILASTPPDDEDEDEDDDDDDSDEDDDEDEDLGRLIGSGPMSETLSLLKTTFTQFNSDKAPRLAAAVAFTTIFSIAPLLIITISIVGEVLGFAHSAHPHTQVENSLILYVQNAAGHDAAVAVRSMVRCELRQSTRGRDRANHRLGHVHCRCIGRLRRDSGCAQHGVARRARQEFASDHDPRSDRLDRHAARDRISLARVVSSRAPVSRSCRANFANAFPFPAAGLALAAINWIVSLAVITVLFADDV